MRAAGARTAEPMSEQLSTGRWNLRGKRIDPAAPQRKARAALVAWSLLSPCKTPKDAGSGRMNVGARPSLCLIRAIVRNG
jgi:hypothetical protein